MPNILILDFETTGLDTTQDRIIEIGAILYCSDNKRIIRKYSTLVRHDLLENIPIEIQELTRITPDILNKNGMDAVFAFKTLMTLIYESDYILAHNGTNFDFPMLESNLSRYSLPTNYSAHKMDSCVDFPYPANIKTRKLSYLVAEHGLTMSQPAHCAIADCESLLSLMLCYDIKSIIERSHEPSVTLRAIIHREDNDLARAAGFRYTNKKWIRTCKASEVEAVRTACSFTVI